MAWIAVGVVVAAALAVGRPLRLLLSALAAPAGNRGATAGGGPGWRWALDGLAGLVAIHLTLLLLDFAGVPWRRRYLALAVAALVAGLAWAAVSARRAADGRDGARPLQRSSNGEAGGRWLGWGDAVAAAVLAIYAALAWQLRIATPDFVYHWGIKGHRFALARGIDWAFLADPLHLTDHPDYPNLLPDLYAVTALVQGRFDERAMMLWSVAFFVVLLAAARECWRRLAVGAAGRQAGTAAVALAVGMFAVGYHLAGGADWLPAVALLAALPALLAPAPRGAADGAAAADDLAVGLAAALAVGAKIEGLPLAACLVAVHLVIAHRRRDGRGAARAALLTVAPPLAVAAPWLAGCLRYGLFQPTNAGALDWGHAAVVFPALAEALATREWHGLGWLVLAAPVLIAFARTRPLGVVVTLQLLTYLYVYLSAPIDPRFYVLSSFPRLLFHLMPAMLVGAVVLIDAATGTRSRAVSVGDPARPGAMTATSGEPRPAGPPHAARGGGRGALVVLIAVTAVAVFIGWRTFYFLTDDAYIAFRYVANAVDGYGLVWNPPPFRPVEGYTSLLWVILLKTVWQLTGVEPPAAANVLALAFGYATLVIGLLLARRMELPPGAERARFALFALVVLGTITNRTFLAWLSSGLETSLFNFLITWWLFEALTRPARRSSLWPTRLAAAAALAALARPEGMLAAAGSAWLLLSDARRRTGLGAAVYPALAGAAPLALVPLHLLWRHSLYGEWLPNTYYAKVEGVWLASGLRYVACFALENGTWVWCLLAMGWLVKTGLAAVRHGGERHRLGSHHLVPYGVLAISFTYYTLVVGGDHFEYRVLSHLVLLSLLSAVWLAARLFPRPAVALAAVTVFVVASYPIGWIHWWETRNLNTRERTHVLVQPIAARFPPPLRAVVERWDGWQAWLIRHHVGMRHQEHKEFHRFTLDLLPTREMGSQLPWQPGRPIIAAWSVGILGWVLPHVAVIDRLGLNDRVIARRPPEGPAESRLMAHDRHPPPGYVECFRPNLSILGSGKVELLPRGEPLTDEEIRACENRAW